MDFWGRNNWIDLRMDSMGYINVQFDEINWEIKAYKKTFEALIEKAKTFLSSSYVDKFLPTKCLLSYCDFNLKSDIKDDFRIHSIAILTEALLMPMNPLLQNILRQFVHNFRVFLSQNNILHSLYWPCIICIKLCKTALQESSLNSVHRALYLSIKWPSEQVFLIYQIWTTIDWVNTALLFHMLCNVRFLLVIKSDSIRPEFWLCIAFPLEQFMFHATFQTASMKKI